MDGLPKFFILYVKYKIILNELLTNLNCITCPQKQMLINNVVICIVGRIIELRHEITLLKQSDFPFIGDVLSEARITHEEAEIRLPQYFEFEKTPSQEKLQIILENQELSSEQNVNAVSNSMELEDAVLLIQIHERARQGRLRARFMKEFKRHEQLQNTIKSEQRKVSTSIENEAAIKIQRVWRGHSSRMKTKINRYEELSFLDMVEGQSKGNVFSPYEDIENIRKYREINMKKYSSAIKEYKQKLCHEEKPKLMEKFRNEVRTWMLNYYKKFGKFPNYPTDDGLVSVAVLEQTTEETSEKNEKILLKDETESFELRTSSNFLRDLVKHIKSYEDLFKHADVDGKSDIIFYESAIKADGLKEVEAEVRLQVDETMKAELERLQQASICDGGRRNKGGKKPVKNPKKSKKIVKRKKDKDLTPDRSFESLCEELISQKIIRKCLPEIHLKSPLLKSILLTGPTGCGKHVLVNAICTKTGATLIDLSISTIAGKYPGKAGSTMLIHLVNKISRLVQPCIILISGVELVFSKKTPKASKIDAKRLRKELPKLVKGITVEDRILVIGISSEPFHCDVKSLNYCFQKTIYVSKPGYASRHCKYISSQEENILKMNQVKETNKELLDLTTLSKLSDGFTPKQIHEVIKTVLTERRLKNLTKHPLLTSEFILPFAKYEPEWIVKVNGRPTTPDEDKPIEKDTKKVK
ncbi:Dynein regulatory complex protein 11 [Nymphon striatum]|nr:Dynein regulatory complex protein 11 [Nymphon striatum]